MNKLELHVRLEQISGDIESFSLALAEPDIVAGDTVDVTLAVIARIEVLREEKQIRMYPPIPDEPAEHEYESLGVFLECLPKSLAYDDDQSLRLMVELPLIREDSSLVDRELREIEDVHIGAESKEVWLLVRPLSEYSKDVLPA